MARGEFAGPDGNCSSHATPGHVEEEAVLRVRPPLARVPAVVGASRGSQNLVILTSEALGAFGRLVVRR